MAEHAVGLLGPAIEVAKLVAKPIGRQFNYLCCFTSNINSLKDEAQKLDYATEVLQGVVDSAKNNVQDPVPEVKTWLTNSNNLNDKINEILDEAKNVGTGCLKLRARFSLSKRAKKTTDRTIELRGQKPEVEFKPGPIAATQGVQLEKPFECKSRNEIEEGIMTALKHMIGICRMGGLGKTSCKFCNPDNSEDIMKTLRGGDVNMIGICGMGGLGKTTMAKKIMNRVLKEDVFDEVVFATVSHNDISKIQDEIGGSLGLKLEEEKTQSARVLKLHSRLSDSKRILLVLDDVWKRLELEDFGIPRDFEGCKIFLTSRNRNVLRAMDVKIFEMKVLSEEEAWSFFIEEAGTCVNDGELRPIAEEVAKECGGLPIALAVVGRGLKGCNSASWKSALLELKQCLPNTAVGFEEKVYNLLKWSYNRLESEQDKDLFLLCCLFPDDADIPLEYLTNFCKGLGIFKRITNMEDAWNKMWALTEVLKDRSLLLDSDKKTCVRMHDVVRDVCTLIAKEKGYIGKDGCTWISSSHLVEGERNELLSGSKCPKLRLLFLDSRYDDDSLGFKFDDAFLEGMRELSVLCIQNYSFTTLPHVPTQSLAKLNTLILDSCDELETISVVGHLRNLEILIFRNCNSIKELPREMKGLNRLKVLELIQCRELQSIERGIISSLVGLEELKMWRSFVKWEEKDSEEKENAGARLRELEKLTKLTCLEIDIKDPSLLKENMPRLSKKIVRFIIRTDGINCFFPSKFSKATSLCLERETRLGDWIEMQLLRDTECLYLDGNGASNVKNVVRTSGGDDAAVFPYIRWLDLGECESMKNVDATVFPSIEHLKLEDLPELQEICDGPISSTSFQNLKELELNGLRALTQFWKSSRYVPHFTNLSSIRIYECDRLRNLGQLSMAGKGCLPQLEQLRICLCSMMEQVFLWNNEEAGENNTKVFPKLKKVWLAYLPKLTTFYQGIQGIKFPLLREMEIDECPKMKSIIGSSSADIDDSLHLLCQPQKVLFGSLEVLQINKYVGSVSLFTLSMAANLVSLRKLCIENCDEMIKVIEDEQQEKILLFPKLEELTLWSLPKLVSFCEWICEVELPLLRKVEIERCPNMENLRLGLLATPNLEAFTTDLTTYVGVGIGDGVAFNSLKELEIRKNENLLYGHKISVSLFNGLEKLIFYECNGTMSLFSSSAVRNLVNLRVLEIKHCHGILVSVIEDEEEKENGKVVRGGVVFPKLDELRLDDLPKLVSLCEWKCDVEFPSLTKVEIWGCHNMENFSMGIVAAPKLKIVQIDGCNREIGGTKDMNAALPHYLARKKISFGNSFKELKINHNSFYGHKIPSSLFKRLEKLTINEYRGSMSLFTLSMAANLVSLRCLYIRNCDEMIKVIEDEQQVASGGQRIILFPKLEILKLINLSKLMSFCDSKCEVELPLLREVFIERSPNMENLSLGLIATPNLEAFSTDLTTYVGIGVDVAFNSLKALDIFENENPWYDHKISVSLFRGLEKLEFYEYKGSMSLFSSSAVENLVNLKVLKITLCDEMLVYVIEDEEEKEDGKVVSGGVVFPKLEELTLSRLPKLVRFCEWKCDVELPSLTKVEIDKCPNLENFSMGLVATPNLEAFRTDLTTYVGVGVDVAFNSLNALDIFKNKNPWYDHKFSVSLFNGLEKLEFLDYKGSMSLFSSSAVGNLVNLKVLKITLCDEMLVNVIEDEEEKEDGKVVSGGVVFPKLEELTLSRLPKLVRFCEWKCDVELPSLSKLKIRWCPNMENFSMGFVAAPKLIIVEIDSNDIGGTKDLNWALKQHYLARREKEINEEEKSSDEKDEIEDEDQN